MILEYTSLTKGNSFFDEKRNEQNKFWLIQTIEEQLQQDFFGREEIKSALKEQLALIELNKTTPFVAAEYLLSLK
jgi:LAO/AO transport system kinase